MPSILATQYWVMKPMGELQGQHWHVCFHVLHHQIRECCGSLLQDCNVLVCMLSLLGMSGALCQHWIQKNFQNSMFIGFSMCFSWDFNRNFTTSEPRVDDLWTDGRFTHPWTQEEHNFTCAPPQDFEDTWRTLRQLG